MSLYAKLDAVPRYNAFVKCAGTEFKLPLLVMKNRISIPAYFGVDSRDKILSGITSNNCLIVAQGDVNIKYITPPSIESKPHTSGYNYWYMPYASDKTSFKYFNPKNVTWGVGYVPASVNRPSIWIQRSTIPTNYINIVQYECFSASSGISSMFDYQIIELNDHHYYTGAGIIVPSQDYGGVTNLPNSRIRLHYCTIRKTTSYTYLKSLLTPFETKTAVSGLACHGIGFIFEFSNTARWYVEN